MRSCAKRAARPLSVMLPLRMRATPLRHALRGRRAAGTAALKRQG